jgi:hypothetical protein
VRREQSGPEPLPHDSWDDTLALMRRLLPGPVRTNRYRWVLAVAGLVVTVTLVVLAIGPTSRFVSSGSSPSKESTVDGDWPGGPGIAATHSDPVTSSSSSSSDPVSSGSGLSSSATDSSSSSGFSGSSGSNQNQDGSGPVGTPSLPPPAVVLEAEGAGVVRTGSAAVTADPAASGGAYVDGVGYWSDAAPAGSLVFTADLPSGGDWRLTIYFLDPGPKGPRHATIDVSGADAVTLQFAGWPGCCGTRTLDLSLAAGTHTVAIGDPTATAPSIDRITFTLLP